MLRDDIILPVLNGSVSFHLLCFQVHSLDVHPSVIRVGTEPHFAEFLCEELLVSLFLAGLEQSLHRDVPAHLCSREGAHTAAEAGRTTYGILEQWGG